MNQEIKIQGGLLPTPKDARDFQLGQVFRLPKLEELPEEFELSMLSLKDQGGSDMCTAYMSTYMSEIQEGVELNPLFSFAASKAISGNPDVWGQDIRTALKAHVEYGALEEKVSPYRNPDEQNARKLEVWARELIDQAREHRKRSYFKITGPYGAFDNIRASIWLMRSIPRAVGFGLVWGWDPVPAIIPNNYPDGFGHAITAIGWKKIEGETYLVIQNSYGSRFGDQGRHFFPREVINKYVAVYGAYMFIDMDPEEVKSQYWSIWQKFINWLKKLFR